MLQLHPDYSFSGTIDHVRKEFGEGFSYKGTGFYLSDTDTVLIVPKDDTKNPWRQVVGEMVTVHVYNCHWRDTIFSQAAIIPVREDYRQ